MPVVFEFYRAMEIIECGRKALDKAILNGHW
jgi:hypothetical protein